MTPVKCKLGKNKYLWQAMLLSDHIIMCRLHQNTNWRLQTKQTNKVCSCSQYYTIDLNFINININSASNCILEKNHTKFQCTYIVWNYTTKGLITPTTINHEWLGILRILHLLKKLQFGHKRREKNNFGKNF